MRSKKARLCRRRSALDLATTPATKTAQALTHIRLIYLWERRGKYPQALDHTRQAHRAESRLLMTSVWC